MLQKFNLNGHVRVEVTPHGWAVLQAFHDRMRQDVLTASKGERDMGPFHIEVDERGYSRFQAWWFFHVVGPHLYNGAKPVCDMNIIVELP